MTRGDKRNSTMFTFYDPGRLVVGDLSLVLCEAYPGDSRRNYVPAYRFRMMLNGQKQEVGRIELRVGNDDHIVLDLVTLEKRDLLTEPVQWVFLGFDWSPDGKRLAVVVRQNNQRHLWIVSADGSSPPKPRLQQNLDGRVSWSPDGKRLAISSNRKIYLLEPAGRGTQMLPDQRGDSVEPAWSPDGKFFAVSGNHPLAATKP